MPSPNDFAKYTRDARGETPHINFFLAQIVQCVNPDTADKFCRSAIANLYERRSGKDGQPGTPSSRCTFASYYRKALEQAAADFGMPAEIKAVCIPILKGSVEDIAATRSKQQKRTRDQQSHLTPFNPQAVLAQIETALSSDDWREIAAALVMCCHARPADVLKLGSFKALSEYQVEFTAKAKKRGGKAVGNIWVMVPAARFVDAFSRLRRMPEVLRYQKMSNSKVDSSSNSNIGRAIQQTFGEVLPIPHGARGEASASNARAAATNLAQWLYGRDEIHIAELAMRQLMHDSPNAESSYRDYRLADESGQAIKDYGVRLNSLGPTVPYYFYDLNPDGSVKKDSMIPDDSPAVISLSSTGKITINAKPITETMPKSTTKTSMTIDRQLLEGMDSFGPGSRSEQLVHIMALAHKAAEFEAQFLYQKEQNLKLRTKAAATPQTAPANGDYATTTEATTTTAETELRMLQDAELKGKKSGFAEERIRRTVAALQDWNAGKELEEQIEVNMGSLRQLAAASASKVGEWAKDHYAELQAYAEGQGHPFTPNSKFNRGKDIAGLIKLPWNE
jgi:hypothetical protein